MLWSVLQEIKAKTMELNEAAFNEYMLKSRPFKEGKVFSEFHYNIRRKQKWSMSDILNDYIDTKQGLSHIMVCS